MVYKRELEVGGMSMKATDLMIGDWVLISVWDCKPFPSKVTSINYNSYQGKDYDDWIDTEDEEDIEMNDVQPITLTPEILEKNGFEKKEDDEGQELYSLLLGEWAITYMSIFGCPYLTIEDVLDYDRAHSVLNLKDTVYHVHELQHELRKIGYEIYSIN